MREGWREVAVEDVAQVVGGGTPKINVPEYWGGDVQWLTPKDLADRPARYTSAGARTITEAGLRGSGAKVLPAGAVLLTSRAPVGYVSVASAPIATNQGFKSLILQDGQLPEFWYYLLLHSTEYLRANSGGSTFQEISGGALKKLRFLVPPLDEQRRIVDLIGALDDTIAAAEESAHQLTEAMIHLPAAVARRGHDLGWESGVLKDVLGGESTIRTGPFGSQLHQSDYVEDGPVAVVMPANMRRGRVELSGAARILETDAVRLARHVTRAGDILWSRRGDVTRFAVIDDASEGSLCGTGCFLLRPEDPGMASWLEVILSSPETGRWLVDNAVGATMANLNRTILGNIPVVIPPLTDRMALSESWSSMRTADRALAVTITTLRTLRSNLLTALLSGEHEIPESYDELMEELAA